MGVIIQGRDVMAIEGRSCISHTPRASLALERGGFSRHNRGKVGALDPSGGVRSPPEERPQAMP